MRHLALDVIHDEHQALAAMLRSMSLLVDQAHREGHAPDFAVLRAMLFYVDEFPERLHHPKESELLFPQVRARCPELAATLDGLYEYGAAHGFGRAGGRAGAQVERRAGRAWFRTGGAKRCVSEASRLRCGRRRASSACCGRRPTRRWSRCWRRAA